MWALYSYFFICKIYQLSASLNYLFSRINILPVFCIFTRSYFFEKSPTRYNFENPALPPPTSNLSFETIKNISELSKLRYVKKIRLKVGLWIPKIVLKQLLHAPKATKEKVQKTIFLNTKMAKSRLSNWPKVSIFGNIFDIRALFLTRWHWKKILNRSPW